MIAYGLAKAAVHHLVKSTGTDPTASGMAQGVRVVGICPIMLDTPMNRKYMAEGTDTSSWTPLECIARYSSILIVSFILYCSLYIDIDLMSSLIIKIVVN